MNLNQLIPGLGVVAGMFNLAGIGFEPSHSAGGLEIAQFPVVFHTEYMLRGRIVMNSADVMTERVLFLSSKEPCC